MCKTASECNVSKLHKFWYSRRIIVLLVIVYVGIMLEICFSCVEFIFLLPGRMSGQVSLKLNVADKLMPCMGFSNADVSIAGMPFIDSIGVERLSFIARTHKWM
jgi:hypothetical protein